MPKEIIYASIAGSILGLIIAFGVWRTNSAFKVQTKTEEAVSSSKPKPADPTQFDLSIAKPSEEDLISQTPVTISGLTKAGSWVLVSGENKDYLIQAGNDGTFTQDVDLISGINQVKIFSFDTNGTTITKNLNLVYTSEFGTQKQ